MMIVVSGNNLWIEENVAVGRILIHASGTNVSYASISGPTEITPIQTVTTEVQTLTSRMLQGLLWSIGVSELYDYWWEISVDSLNAPRQPPEDFQTHVTLVCSSFINETLQLLTVDLTFLTRQGDGWPSTLEVRWGLAAQSSIRDRNPLVFSITNWNPFHVEGLPIPSWPHPERETSNITRAFIQPPKYVVAKVTVDMPKSEPVEVLSRFDREVLG